MSKTTGTGESLLAGDAAHLFPAPGVALNAGLLVDEQPVRRLGDLLAGVIRYPLPNPNHHALTGTFSPDLPLGSTSLAELMHCARPLLLDLADRPDLRQIAQDWGDRIQIQRAKTDQRPADALLIRPDAYIAWAATIDQPSASAATSLQQALTTWFGPSGRKGGKRG